MNILVTGTRQPFALDEIRKFGKFGHRIVAADTFETSPGIHSRYVDRAVITVSPRFDTQRFIHELRAAILEHRIELLVPSFEEAFYIGKHHHRFTELCEVFAPPFDTLASLHHKGTFAKVAKEAGIDVPRSVVVETQDDLRKAVKDFDEYIARAVYSRGGTQLLCNVGPLAKLVSIDDCHPTPENPWLVQEYIRGEDVCTFAVCREGQVTAHCTYVHPVSLEHSGGLVFHSIEEPGAVEASQKLARHVGYHGQMSLDLRRTEDGRLLAIECNPRATAGVEMMSADDFVEGVLGEIPDRPRVTPPGVRRMIGMAVLRKIFRDPRNIREDLPHLLDPQTRDVFAESGDMWPWLYQMLSYGVVKGYREWANKVGRKRDTRTDVIHAYSYDLAWNGEPIR